MAKYIEDCISLDDIDERLNCIGRNMPGIISKVIYGYHNDVAVWPDEPMPATNGNSIDPLSLDEAGALKGDLIMKEGKRAFVFEFNDDVGNFAITMEGEQNNISFLATLTIVKYKIIKTILGFINAASGRKLFFIVEDENGTYFLMGDKKRGAWISTASEGITTGTTTGDKNQTSLQFTYRSGMAYVYEGDTEDILKVVPTTEG